MKTKVVEELKRRLIKTSLKKPTIYGGETKTGEWLNDCLQGVRDIVIWKIIPSCSPSPLRSTEPGHMAQAGAKNKSGSSSNDKIQIRTKHEESKGNGVSRKVPEKFMSALPMNSWAGKEYPQCRGWSPWFSLCPHLLPWAPACSWFTSPCVLTKAA